MVHGTYSALPLRIPEQGSLVAIRSSNAGGSQSYYTMGGCCSRLLGIENATDNVASGSNQAVSELVQMSTEDTSHVSIKVDPTMSSPSIQIHSDGITVSGNGLALAGTSVEQDSVYWEWRVGEGAVESSRISADDDNELLVNGTVKFGVCTKKSPEFYQEHKLLPKEGNAAEEEGHMTVLMREIPKLCYGDTVAVAVQQSDLPMIQFLHNGEWVPNLAIHRFRGSVYPSIFISNKAASESHFTATFQFLEHEFQHRPADSSKKLLPLIAARSLV